MALKMRKDIKKSSYYVWFLGAQESKGLRGSEYVLPVVKSLIQRERTVEPFKVTLQVSHKGLKIIQNVPQNPQAPKSKKPEVVKHFIPHHAVTCVIQDVDIVSCILLLYNPVTKCPVHVHAYRCDSVETAEILKGQLQTLIERPDNQKKLGEIEARLRAKGLLPPAYSRPAPARRLNSGGGSDGRSTSTRESESSGGSSSERLSGVGNQERITNLYDSLAAELREKLGGALGKRSVDPPILLPPRDYDTVHRQKGNLTAIDLRRCLNSNIVGVNVKKEGPAKKGALGSSGGSSGIGSDHAPSPDQVDPDQRYLDNQSTSDEEWTEQPSEDSLFLVQPGVGWPRTDLSLPRARRLPSNEPPPTPSPPSPPRRPRQRSPSPPARPYQPKSRALTNNTTISKLSPRDRFKDAKEKFLLLERERLDEQERAVLKTCEQTKKRGSLHEMPISPVSRPAKPSSGWVRSRDSEDEVEDRGGLSYEDDVFERGYPRREGGSKPRETDDRGKGRSKRVEQYSPPSDGRSYDRPRRFSGEYSPERKPRKSTEFSPEERPRRSEGFSPERKLRHPEFSPEQKPRHPEFSPERKPRHQEFSPEPKPRHPEFSPERKPRHQEFSPEPKPRHPEFSPERKPRHQEFSPERKPRHQEFSPERKPRRGSDDLSPERRHPDYSHPRAAARRDYPGEGRYRGEAASAKYRSPDRDELQAQDKKRRSMFDVLEEERRRSSNELAKEFKRRSFQDAPSEHSRTSNLEDSRERREPRVVRGDHRGGSVDSRGRGHGNYQELSENERFPGLDRETARHVIHRNMSSAVPDGRYRHSYAEPGLSHCLSLSQPHHDLLHRTNSTLSSGRVGIAAIHPY